MSKVKEEIMNLKDRDIYSLILFSLYKIKNIPEYSSLSELAFLLDKESLLKLCEYFGGTTLTIPTIKELETLVYSLVLYEYVNVDGIDYNDAIKIIGSKSSDIKDIKNNYLKLIDILDNYKFDRNYSNV